ncbi:MAG: carbonic anhydrase family protein [Phycisphaerales bacterium]|nr:carbonic anhydrase family protein [Phycisphaerales bacterium]
MISTGTSAAIARAAVYAAAIAITVAFITAPARAGDDAHGQNRVASHTSVAKPSERSPQTHWGYTGHSGPSHWGTLSPRFRSCAMGNSQSPIDLAPSEGASVEPILFDYHAAPLSIIHNGHTVQVSYPPGSSISIGDKKYELLQFHFHTPSEHSLNGHRTEMELHFVHRSKDGHIAVVGVLLNTGAFNVALSEIWKRMPARESAEQIHRNVMINAADLLPKRKKYFRYMGSLTTPPCTEGVHWYVLDTPVTIGEGQAKRFSDAVGSNARPLQALYDRLLLSPRK